MQGTALRPEEIQRIVRLLAETQMTMPEIAQRMHCSRSAVLSINRKFKVRDYQGHRTSWQQVSGVREQRAEPEICNVVADTVVNESFNAA